MHLDSAFAWCGATGDAARARRQALREALLAIAELARNVDADALFCAGDLYEHDRVTPDTAGFLRQTFAELGPIRVYIAPGNHDFYGPQSLYATSNWSDNVHIFTEPRLQPVPLADGITLWGAAHCAPANTPNFLDRFRTDGDATHIALFHGAERS
ncbi:MAG: metallophosphoesterase, partial [Gammaproteobacteria bacterium]|nr:metallophosphoesterase [Gammaproteobacteria bacterium]